MQAQFHQQTAWAMSEQSAKIANDRMRETMVMTGCAAAPPSASYLEERPYLSNVGFESPQVALDILNQAYHALRDEVNRRDDQRGVG